MERQHKQLEEGTSRIPKANPCPYTTDYPHVKKLVNLVAHESLDTKDDYY